MTPADAVARFLDERGCPPEVVTAGLEGLGRQWEEIVVQVEQGYTLTLDDYLNDMDLRDLLHGALQAAGDAADPDLRARVAEADRRLRESTVSCGCLWGRENAVAEGWSDKHHWWYFRRPARPGDALRDDLTLEGLM